MKEILKESGEKQARYYHQHRAEQPLLKVGDMVLLQTRNIRSKRPSEKLSTKKIGPFKVGELVGDRAVRLELPRDLKLHPVFNVELLEPYVQRKWEVLKLGPVEEEVEGEPEWEVERIVTSAQGEAKMNF